ncbi:MAG TPA: glycosyltransferase [Blastococcus sp.]|nr:glycosyltransferase [Blastococcus sp.]
MARRLALGPGPAPAPASADGAVLVRQVELSEGVGDIAAPARPGPPYAAVRLLVRLHGQPLGFVTLPLVDGRLAASAIAEQVSGQLRSQVNAHLVEDALTPVASITAAGVGAVLDPRCRRRPAGGPGGPLVTVVVATRDRPQSLARCLQALAEVTYAPFEVVVVDNAPSTRETLAVVQQQSGQDARVRYVRELRPGVSCARNRGLGEARGELVAFTDDDVVVDPGWLDGVLRGFDRSPSVGCVTGLVPSARLDTAEQRYFDRRVSWALGCTPRRYDRHGDLQASPLYPYTAGQFGTGANFAFRTAVLRNLGGFDEALGPGTPTAAGEDLDLFVRTILAGHTIAYEPAAIAWHHHRDELGQLRHQLFNYGVGLAAFATKYLSDRRTARDVLVRLPGGLRHLRGIAKRVDRPAELPRTVLTAELLGLAWGPIAYGLGRRRHRRRHAGRMSLP